MNAQRRGTTSIRMFKEWTGGRNLLLFAIRFLVSWKDGMERESDFPTLRAFQSSNPASN